VCRISPVFTTEYVREVAPQSASLSHDMSLKVVRYQDLPPGYPEHAITDEPKTFFDMFDTTKCLLDCPGLRDLHRKLYCKEGQRASNRGKIKKKKELDRMIVHQYLQSHQEWYTSAEILASTQAGCTSCSVLQQIFRHIFPGDGHGLSGDYQYSTAGYVFELRRRPVEQDGIVETVQLFQPSGTHSSPESCIEGLKS
jgi:hypothetical protein